MGDVAGPGQYCLLTSTCLSSSSPQWGPYLDRVVDLRRAVASAFGCEKCVYEIWLFTQDASENIRSEDVPPFENNSHCGVLTRHEQKVK